MQREFRGIWIPANLWLDETLSITEKVMLVEIDSLDSSERGCYASNSHFAKFFGLSPSRVSEIINALARRGLISIELIRSGRQIVERRIRVTGVFGKPNTYSENAENPIRKTEEGYSEKAKERDTSMSNTSGGDTTGSGEPAAAAAPAPVPVAPTPSSSERSTRTDWLAILIARGVTEKVARDWLEVRKAKKAAVTATALEGIAREAAKVSMSLEDALRMCCERGWAGFRASWVDRPRDAAPAGAPVFDPRDSSTWGIDSRGRFNASQYLVDEARAYRELHGGAQPGAEIDMGMAEVIQ